MNFSESIDINEIKEKQDVLGRLLGYFIADNSILIKSIPEIKTYFFQYIQYDDFFKENTKREIAKSYCNTIELIKEFYIENHKSLTNKNKNIFAVSLLQKINKSLYVTKENIHKYIKDVNKIVIENFSKEDLNQIIKTKKAPTTPFRNPNYLGTEIDNKA